MVSQKNKELFSLMDLLHKNKEELEYYAIKRNKSGKLHPNRLDRIEQHAMEIYLVSAEILSHVRTMKRK